MTLSRLVLVAAAAAGAAYYFKGRAFPGLTPAPRQRLTLAGDIGGAVPASPLVAETMWTPSEPVATGGAPVQSTRGP